MKNVTFPETVRRKSCSVTIYRILNRGNERFTLAFYDADGQRQRQTYLDYLTAKEAAEALAAELAEGGFDVRTLRGKERYAYERAVEVLKPTGLGLDSATLQLVEALQILNGTASLVDAAKFYIRHQPKHIRAKLVSEIVEEMLADRAKEGVSALHLRDLRIRLERFKKAFHCPIASISVTEINGFVNSLNVGLRTRKNFLDSIGNLINYAKSREYLPSDHPGVKALSKAQRGKSAVRIFSVEEMTMLLSAAKPEILVPLAITAFSGVRAEELKRLDWCDIKLERGFIEIKESVSKTKVRRLVAIPENLRAWLLPLRQQSGPLVPFKKLCWQYTKLGRDTGLPWRRNALRHSFVSYRLAVTKDVARVALEAGTSSRMVFVNYLEVVPEEDGKRWFSIFPERKGDIIPMPEAPTTMCDGAVAS